MSQIEEFAALWPGGVNAVPAIPPAPRLAGLDGKRIGFLWDYVFRGEEIFPALERSLTASFAGLEIVDYEAFGSTFGGDEHAVLAALPQRLQALKIDAVISGIGC
ncbi:MAG: hypothetical protein H8E30_03250 [Alphaproteobacteria bacterium]|nr:hypothetical protein [Alphaproteobacteria bacterium]